MPHGAADVRAHVRRGEQNERERHRVGRDRDRRGQRREQSLAAVRHPVADDDQHETRERERA